MHTIFSDESDQLELKRKNSLEHLQAPSGLINHPFLQFNLNYEFSNNYNLEYSGNDKEQHRCCISIFTRYDLNHHNLYA
jgi:hypothetical protein